jgi:peptide chain release factor 1
MFEHLQDLEKKHDELYGKLAEPALLADQALYRETTKKLAEIRPMVELYRRYRKAVTERDETRQMLQGLAKDDELKVVAEEELASLETSTGELEAQLRQELETKDPNDERNVVLEIRAGTGGDEASLFAAELFRTYSRYAERHGYRVSILDLSESGVRGVKEVSAIVEGRGAWSRLKYEGGVHRVQRVPETEASGRIHTSAVTVAVLPEAEDIEVTVDEKDLRIDRFCASGPGGQGVNTTYSAVRLTHLPTGIVVSCQDERSQIKNKAKAMKILRSRLLEIEQQKQDTAIRDERRGMVGGGDRSEKIRTYNFPQNRVTDHRVGITLYKLERIMDGELQELIEAVVSWHQATLLEEQNRDRT